MASSRKQQIGQHADLSDQFTGALVQLQDGVKPCRAEAIINQFGAVHFGTFGGRVTQVLYVFVGLAPLILFVTGFVMWRYRKNVSNSVEK